MGAWIEICRTTARVTILHVAPLVGAWIEISQRPRCRDRGAVAPLVGAWIEISGPSCRICRPFWSRPSWARGLKFEQQTNSGVGDWVAPLVGAWIEISKRHAEHSARTSRPLWARGLKYLPISQCRVDLLSRPLWARGLKSRSKVLRILLRQVAPLVGAWIEIGDGADKRCGFIVAPLVGAWIEMQSTRRENCGTCGRAPCGRVD